MSKPSEGQVSPIDVSVIVPTLNEAENIGLLLDRIQRSMERSPRYEVIVVDDGSDDGTRERVQEMEALLPVRLICRDRKGGLSGAVLRGAQEARGEVVVVMDADLSHPPEDLPRLIEPIITGACDVTVGSRHVEGGRIVGWPIRRHLTSRVAAWLASPFVDITDPMSGFFATRRERFASVNADVAGFKILLELLSSQQGRARVCEVPIEFRDREHGESKLSGGVIRSYLLQLKRLSGVHSTTGTMARFGLVGVGGVVVDLSIFAVLTAIGLTIGSAHISSFLVATLFNYVLNDSWSFRRADASRSGLSLGRYMGFFGVCLAALFVRGGVVASGMEFGLSPTVAVLLAIGAAAIVNYAGSALFVFGGLEREKTTAQWRIVAAVIVVYSVVLRLVYMGVVDLLPEEAYYWNYAKNLDIGYLDHPPMISWLIAGSTYLFGNNEIAVRLPALGCWLISLGFVFALAGRVVSRSAAFAAAAMFSVLPYFFMNGMIATPDAPLVACWAAALYFLHRAIVGRRHEAWIWFGLAVGLGMLSKYTIAILGPAALAIMLLDASGRRALLTRWPYLGGLLAMVVFSPVILWNAMHGWASFEFQTVRRLAETPEFGIPFLGLSLLILLSPAGILSTLRVLGIRAWRRTGPTLRNRRFLLLATVVPLAVFVLFSFDHKPKLNWTGPLWLALLPLMALDFEPIVDRVRSGFGRFGQSLGWRLTFVITLFAFGAGLHYMTLGLPHAGYLGRMAMPVGWEELGSAVEGIEDELEYLSGVEPMVVGMDKYNLASQLAFYRTKAHKGQNPRHEGWKGTASSHLFGHPALMYEMWFRTEDIEGRDCILVAYNESGLADGYLAPWFDELLPIQSIAVRKNGEAVHEFYWRVGKRYRGFPDAPAPALAKAASRPRLASRGAGRAKREVPPIAIHHGG